MKTISSILKIGLLTVALLISNAVFADNSFNPAQQKQIQNIVHDYLINNPQVLMESIQTLQNRARTQMMKQAQQVIDAQYNQLFNSPNSPVLGNPNGKVTLVEFADYQCQYCKKIAPGIDDLLKNNSNVRFVIKELPIFGESSLFASQAALASRLQNKYPAFHNALMAARPPFNDQQILNIAKSVGLDIDKLQSDMKSDSIISELKTNVALANQMQLVGTPAFIVANIKINGTNTAKPAKSIFIPGAVSMDNLQKAIQSVQ